MTTPIRLVTPLSDSDVRKLRTGDKVLLSGILYTARDAAHKRLSNLLETGASPPFELAGQVIYYTGPTPAPPGRIIGSAGPTTSERMDVYTPALLEKGVKGLIGKGRRSAEVKAALTTYGAVYFAATGGAGALLGKRIRSANVIAYSDLGPEAIFQLVVEDFPLVVVNDTFGGDLYEEGVKRYAR